MSFSAFFSAVVQHRRLFCVKVERVQNQFQRAAGRAQHQWGLVGAQRQRLRAVVHQHRVFAEAAVDGQLLRDIADAQARRALDPGEVGHQAGRLAQGGLEARQLQQGGAQVAGRAPLLAVRPDGEPVELPETISPSSAIRSPGCTSSTSPSNVK